MTWQPPNSHQARYQQWAQDNQETECAVCYGRGWVLQEDASGAPAQEMPCPYCHGARHQGWVVGKRAARFDHWDRVRNKLIIATVVMFLLNGWAAWDPSGGDGSYIYSVLFLVHTLLWLALIAGWVIWWTQHRPKEERPHQAQKHAPGFTDNREKDALGLFAVGLVVRNMLGNLFKDLKK